MADTRAQDYADRLTALTTRAFTLDAAARTAVLDQLKAAAEQIRADLTRADPTSYSATRLRYLKEEVERVMGQFSQAASNDIARSQNLMAGDATRSVDAVMAVGAPANGGWPMAVRPVVDPRLIAVAQGYSADLIKGLSQDTARRINGALTRAALGGSNFSQLVAQIGGALEGGTFSGVFSEAGARAGTIASNEVLRLHSVVSFGRIKDYASRADGVEKEWLHIPVARIPRPAHVAASGQTRPVDAPFLVAGEELMYPRDPAGSAANTICCHCLLRPKLSERLFQPTDEHRALLAKHGISITTSRT